MNNPSSKCLPQMAEKVKSLMRSARVYRAEKNRRYATRVIPCEHQLELGLDS